MRPRPVVQSAIARYASFWTDHVTHIGINRREHTYEHGEASDRDIARWRGPQHSLPYPNTGKIRTPPVLRR